MRRSLFVGAFAAALLFSPAVARTVEVVSPNGDIVVAVADGDRPTWSVTRKGHCVIEKSALGLAFKEGEPLGACLLGTEKVRSIDAIWENRLYRRRFLRDHANETEMEFVETDGLRRRLGFVVRAYDTGVAFRYVVPEQAAFRDFTIQRELTEFRFAGDPLGWFTLYPQEEDGQEQPYLHQSVRSIPLKTPFPDDRSAKMTRIGLPAIVELPGTVLAIAEAELDDWAGLFLEPVPRWGLRPDQSALRARLASRPDGRGAVVSQTPRRAPWRVIALADEATGLPVLADMIQNLNPPSEGDFSWVKAGPCGWDWWAESAYKVSQFKNTTAVKREQIDFAAEMGWPFYMIDIYWCTWRTRQKNGKCDMLAYSDLTEYPPNLDIPEVVSYAKGKGIGVFLWMHWKNLESNGVERVFAQFEKWGVAGVKVDFMERQDQEMVNWYSRVTKCAAKHRLLVNFHGAFHPTGMERTWPNQITREGISANENHRYEWMLTPELTAGLPLTRYLLGPGDYYPGGFVNVRAEEYRPVNEAPPEKRGYTTEVGTRAHALALCVAYDSPLLTMADVPENYRGQPGLEALRNLPSVWDETLVLGGAINDWYLAARKSHEGMWYVSAVTARARTVEIALGFLGEGKWEAEMFRDDPELNRTDARALKIERRTVTGADCLSVGLADIGGAVIRLRQTKGNPK